MNAASNPYSAPVLTINGYRIGEAHLLGIPAGNVAQFIARTWKRRIVLAHPEFYRYQFEDAPGCEARDHCVLVVGGDGDIVGFMGLTPHDFLLQNVTRRACQITTWIFDERVRGKGLGKALVRYLQARYGMIVGFGISDDALPVYLGAGFRFLRFLPRFVRVRDLRSVERVGQVTPLGRKMVEQASRLTREKTDTREIGVDELAGLASAASPTNGFARDEAHLRWRYMDHPVFRHQLVRVESPTGPSGLVVRADEAGGVGYLHVLDMFTTPDRLPWVLGAIDELTDRHEAAFVDIYLTLPTLAAGLWCRGWFSAVDDSYLQVPRLLHPVEMSTPPTTSMILWSSDMCSALDFSSLSISMGDGDLDRPTESYLDEKGVAL